MLIRRINHLLITHGTTGMNNRSRARLHHHVKAVSEREERITSDHRLRQ